MSRQRLAALLDALAQDVLSAPEAELAAARTEAGWPAPFARAEVAGIVARAADAAENRASDHPAYRPRPGAVRRH